MSSFEVVDRRGANKVEEAVKPEEKVSPVSLDNKGWKLGSLVYLVTNMPLDGQPVIAGMAAAMRTDGHPFNAIYYFEQLWSEGFRWEEKARKRLNTFLGCGCQPHSKCSKHKIILPEWLQEDRERLAKAAVAPVPEVIEIMLRAQAARQAANPNILVPRG